MGGSSKSSSETSTYQTDNRIGATDNAVVVAGGSTLNLTDPGLVALAGDALDQNERVLLEVLKGAGSLGITALQSIGSSANKAFDFVDKARTDEDQRTSRTLIPWLVAGASVFAISWAIKSR